MDNQPTNFQISETLHEILETINHFANDTEVRFQRIESDIGSMKSDIGGLKSDIGSMKSDIGSMRATMVTKDYLDEKLGSLRGDLVSLIRKEDRKFAELIEGMLTEKVISQEMAKRIFQMEPFPHLSV